jgi:hypothetical protein
LSILCIDGERVHIARPLRVGDIVKVSLPSKAEGQMTEAPWVKVIKIVEENHMWLGCIANYLIYSHGFDYGDEVLFHDEDGCWVPARGGELS